MEGGYRVVQKQALPWRSVLAAETHYDQIIQIMISDFIIDNIGDMTVLVTLYATGHINGQTHSPPYLLMIGETANTDPAIFQLLK